MVALAEAGAIAAKKSVAKRLDMTLEQQLGLRLKENDEWNRLMESYMQTRSGREGLSDYKAAIADLDELPVDDLRAWCDKLKPLLNQSQIVLPNLRDGEGTGHQERLLAHLHGFWSNVQNAAPDQANLVMSLVQEIFAEAKVSFSLDDKLHDISQEVAKRLTEANREAYRSGVVSAAVDLMSNIASKDMVIALKTALHKTRGMVFNTVLTEVPEANPVGYVRVLLLRQIASDLKVVDADIRLDLVASLNSSAEKGIDQPKFEACHQHLMNARSVLTHFTKVSAMSGDPVGLEEQMAEHHWTPIAEFKRLNMVMIGSSSAVAKDESWSVMECATFVADVQAQVAQASQQIEAMIRKRLAASELKLKTLLLELVQLAGGAPNGGDWANGIKKKATFQDFVAHAQKPKGLFAFEGTERMVKLMLELTDATRMNIGICALYVDVLFHIV